MPSDRDIEKRVMVAGLLASGVSIAEAARRAKVSERSIYRWRSDPEFQRQVEAAEEQQAAAAEAAGPDPDEVLALRTLRRVARDDQAPAAARVAAAKALCTVAAERRKKPVAVEAQATAPINVVSEAEILRFMDGYGT